MLEDKVTLTIDGVQVKARQGERILWAALDAGIYIPNLCAIRGVNPPLAGCRLCFVEIEGRPDLVTACTEPVADGLVVKTSTPRVNRLRRTAFEFLISHHPVDCGNCAKNRKCELQKIASHLRLKLKPKRLPTIPKSLPLDSSHPLFIYDPNKCVLCGKCVWACGKWGTGELKFAFRGIDTVVSTFGNVPLIESSCNSCAQCVAVCPVGALVPKAAGDQG